MRDTAMGFNTSMDLGFQYFHSLPYNSDLEKDEIRSKALILCVHFSSSPCGLFYNEASWIIPQSILVLV